MNVFLYYTFSKCIFCSITMQSHKNIKTDTLLTKLMLPKTSSSRACKLTSPGSFHLLIASRTIHHGAEFLIVNLAIAINIRLLHQAEALLLRYSLPKVHHHVLHLPC